MRFFIMPSTRYLILRTRVAPSRRAQDVRAATVCQFVHTSSAEAREKAHEPAGAWGEQCRRIIASCGALARLAARRVGHDQIGERTDLELLRNRQGPGQDQIAGSGAEN